MSAKPGEVPAADAKRYVVEPLNPLNLETRFYKPLGFQS